VREPGPGEVVLSLGAREQHETLVSAEDYPALARWRLCKSGQRKNQRRRTKAELDVAAILAGGEAA